MNFGQERYSWMEQDPYTGDKIPFYMTYPMQNTLFEETEYEKDCRRMQELYPRDARQIQSQELYPDIAKEILRYAEEACDELEYEGSMMYDRYPDRLMLEMLCRKIYRELNPDHIDEEGRLQVEERYFHLIQVMLMQEMYRRRCRHYRCRRWY